MAYTGKVALVTGAGSGMGQLATRNFAAAGAKVAALDIDEAGLASTKGEEQKIHCHTVDITDFDQLKQVVAEVESELGPIDRVFNCAAIMPLGALLEQEPETMHRLMRINFGGLVNITHAALPGMLKRDVGDFVSFASMAGLMPTLYTGAYSATKAAVAFFNETLYHEHLDSGVRFASVCPPVVNTPLLQQGRDTRWPKMLDLAPPLEPQVVLDEIERCLERGKFLVLPTKNAKQGYWARRLIPSGIWKQVHKVEGC